MSTPKLVVQPIEVDVAVATQIPTSYGASMRTPTIACAVLRELVVYLVYVRSAGSAVKFLLEASNDGGTIWFPCQDDDGTGALIDAEKTKAVTGSKNMAVRFDVSTLRHCRVSVLCTDGAAGDTGILSHNGSNG